MGFGAADGRALPGLRRALEPGRPGGLRGRELRRRRSLPGRGVPGHQRVRAAVGPARRARGRHLLPDPLAASRARATASSSTTPRRATSACAPTTAGAWSVEVTPAPAGRGGRRARARRGPPADCGSSPGPTPAEALRRFTEAVGRQPRAEGAVGVRAVVPARRRRAAELGDAARRRRSRLGPSDLHALPAVRRAGDRRPSRRAPRPPTTAASRSRPTSTRWSARTTPPRYDPRPGGGRADRDTAGEPYIYRYGANIDDLFIVGQYDFFEPAGPRALRRRAREAIGDGYDGWMEDFGEYTPLDSVSDESIDGTRAHNEYARALPLRRLGRGQGRDRPIVRFQRSGWTGAAKCAQVVWGGDPTTGGASTACARRSPRRSARAPPGIGIWGSDIGGFFALGANELTPELLTRWVQFGAVSGVMRTQRNGVALPPRDRPQVTDPDQIDNWRRYTKLRTQLYPYISAAQAEYRALGPAADAPPGPRLPGRSASRRRPRTSSSSGPTCSPRRCSTRARPSATPTCREGRWVDLWRSASYDEETGGLAARRGRGARRPCGSHGARAARGAAAVRPRGRGAAAASGRTWTRWRSQGRTKTPWPSRIAAASSSSWRSQASGSRAHSTAAGNTSRALTATVGS